MLRVDQPHGMLDVTIGARQSDAIETDSLIAHGRGSCIDTASVTSNIRRVVNVTIIHENEGWETLA